MMSTIKGSALCSHQVSLDFNNPLTVKMGIVFALMLGTQKNQTVSNLVGFNACKAFLLIVAEISAGSFSRSAPTVGNCNILHLIVLVVERKSSLG